MVDRALKTLLHDKIRFAITVSGVGVGAKPTEKSVVKKGDLLAEIGVDEPRAALHEAHARAKEAAVDVGFSATELERTAAPWFERTPESRPRSRRARTRRRCATRACQCRRAQTRDGCGQSKDRVADRRRRARRTRGGRRAGVERRVVKVGLLEPTRCVLDNASSSRSRRAHHQPS